MPADWSLGNFLTHNDPWAQDYGNKRFAHWETTGGLALFVVHMEGHMNNTMRRFKLSRDRNQGAAMVVAGATSCGSWPSRPDAWWSPRDFRPAQGRQSPCSTRKKQRPSVTYDHPGPPRVNARNPTVCICRRPL